MYFCVVFLSLFATLVVLEQNCSTKLLRSFWNKIVKQNFYHSFQNSLIFPNALKHVQQQIAITNYFMALCDGFSVIFFLPQVCSAFACFERGARFESSDTVGSTYRRARNRDHTIGAHQCAHQQGVDLKI
jgi:hypothetical protein